LIVYHPGMPESLPGALTTTYTVQFAHSRVEGVSANPIAGPEPQNASLVRLHAPLEMLTVFWTATREGAAPRLPSSKSYFQNYNRVLLSGERVGIVVPNTVGHIWIAAGRFDYCVVGPEGLDSDFRLAKVPWESTDASDFYVPMANFELGIINSTPVPPLGGLPINPAVPLLQPLGPVQPFTPYGPIPFPLLNPLG
jgi:hypothetical protein